MTKRVRAVSRQLGQRVRQRRAIPRAQRGETLRRLAQCCFEVPNAEAGQAAFHSVHDAYALADQVLALAVRALGVFFLEVGIAAMRQ